jgi:hypothetical protein
MTASYVKARYEQYCRMTGRDGYFFCRDTMKFFGDTMANFGVRDGGSIEIITDNGPETVEVWDLYRKKPRHGLYGHCAYFRKDTGEEVGTWSMVKKEAV